MREEAEGVNVCEMCLIEMRRAGLGAPGTNFHV